MILRTEISVSELVNAIFSYFDSGTKKEIDRILTAMDMQNKNKIVVDVIPESDFVRVVIHKNTFFSFCGKEIVNIALNNFFAFKYPKPVNNTVILYEKRERGEND